MNRILVLLSVLLLCGLGTSGAAGAQTLDMYFIDTEGGQATLLVAPSGESMLLDVGNPGFDSNTPDRDAGRDARRIAAAAQLANVRRIDTLVVSHYHGDHVGGIAHLVQQLPVSVFVDHGPAVEERVKQLDMLEGGYPRAYEAAFAKGRHRVVKPGDTLPMRDLAITVVAANGRRIARKGPGNPHCEGIPIRDEPAPGENSSENPASVGLVVEFGKFRFANLGDLTWNKEFALVCPENRLGTVDVYQAAGHGRAPTKAMAAVAPRVVIASNGARKSAGPAAVAGSASCPGLKTCGCSTSICRAASRATPRSRSWPISASRRIARAPT